MSVRLRPRVRRCRSCRHLLAGCASQQFSLGGSSPSRRPRRPPPLRCRPAFRRRILSDAGALPPITRKKTARAPKPRRAANAGSPTTSAAARAAASSCISPTRRSRPSSASRVDRTERTTSAPARSPAGGARDREIVAFDGRVLITRFIDPEVVGALRYEHLCALRRRGHARAQGRQEGLRQREDEMAPRCVRIRPR